MDGQAYRALNEVVARVKACRVLNPWRFHQGPAGGAWTVGLDDSGWREVSLPFSWDARKGEAWFRREIVVPEDVEGIAVSGGAAELCSSVMTIGTEVYVDGQRVFFAPYWADLRWPKLLLSRSVAPGDRFTVVVHTVSAEGLAAMPQVTVEYGRVEDTAFELQKAAEALRFASALDNGSGWSEEAEKALDLDALSERDWARVRSSLDRVRRLLAESAAAAKSHTLHMVGHAHIDMNWLWPWEDTVDVVRRDFDTATRIMDEVPEFRFSQSQAFLYRLAEERFPHLFERMRRKVRSGQWEVTASTWVEGDLNMACGEAIARHLLYSKRYLLERFGVEPRICWEPDTFGHPWTLPQILKKAGIDYYYQMRAGKAIPLYLWEGPDGSRVLAFNEPNTYNNSSDPTELVDRSLLLKDRAGARNSLVVYGVGDHGGGPTMTDIERAGQLDSQPGFPSVRLSRAVDFFDAVAAENLDLPVVRDELNSVFDGCYTTHADIKWHNRKSECLLADAETFAALASVMGSPYPQETLWKAWDATLFNQFHDILDGSAIAASYRHSRRLAEAAEESASQVLRRGLCDIAAGIVPRVPRGEGTPIVVFNSLGWDRTDVVAVPTAGLRLPARPVVRDGAGRLHPVQLAGDKLLFVARDVPPVGYKIFYLHGGGDGRFAPLAAAGQWCLENEHLRVKVDPDSGCLTEVFDKASGRAAMSQEPQPYLQPVYNNLLQVLYEVPHAMSAWVVGGIARTDNLIRGATLELVEAGPVRGVIRVTHRAGRSTIGQDVAIHRGIKRLDFLTEIDWREESGPDRDAPMLKAAFTANLRESRATFEIPFGYIERHADGREVPALRWVDLSATAGDYGLSLLNDSKYGFDVSGNTMRITLLRTSYEPDPRPDQGLHRLVYSIYPHQGDWREGETPRRAEELNRPLIAVPMGTEDIACRRVSGTAAGAGLTDLPEEKSFMRINARNAVISCVKRAEDGSGLVIRVYENEGRETDVELAFGFPVTEVRELDLIERPVETTVTNLTGNAVRFRLGKHEIRMFLAF